MEWINAALILLVVLIVYFCVDLYRRSHYNVSKAEYNIHLHNLHKEDEVEAVELVKQIKSRVSVLLKRLNEKYNVSTLKNGTDPGKKNKIDVIGRTSMYSEFDTAAVEAEKKGLDREELLERMVQLFQNYDGNIYEISPTNKEGLTSYTENKVKLILCLRKKTPNAQGIYELHDINTMMFVVIHELTHVLNDQYDHGPKFWALFEFMLHNAVECGIYSPIDYRKHRLLYCGLLITHNPLYEQ